MPEEKKEMETMADRLKEEPKKEESEEEPKPEEPEEPENKGIFSNMDL